MNSPLSRTAASAAATSTVCTETQLAQLHALALSALHHHFGLGPEARPDDYPTLRARGTTAVSLKLAGRAHGSHASLRRTRSLAADIIFNALAAARDERCAPLQAADLAALEVQIAVHSEAEFLEFDSENALLAQLETGVDGLHLFAGCRNVSQGPQAWAEYPQPAAFLAALKAKAGLPAQRKLSGLMVARYRVSHWPQGT